MGTGFAQVETLRNRDPDPYPLDPYLRPVRVLLTRDGPYLHMTVYDVYLVLLSSLLIH
jgi:hypothetical protein